MAKKWRIERLCRVANTPVCRLFGEMGETFRHIVSECEMLAQRKYRRQHDAIAKNVHCKLCREFGLERAPKWYEHKPGGVARKGNIEV